VDLTVATTAHSLLRGDRAQGKNVVATTAGVTAMNTSTYDKRISALLVVDPYSDFMAPHQSCR